MTEKPNFKTIKFKSKDGLTITADYYSVTNPKGYILLCHRSHFNRGEYREIAPKLNALGYTCLAIDQRSGMNVYGVINGTSTLAKKNKIPTGYLDAKQDIEAAIDYLYKKNNNNPIIILGSSYSASLALIIAVDNMKIKAVMAFSPGEWLKKTSVAKLISNLKKPVFVTSAKKEITDTAVIMENVDPKYITHFKPKLEGQHGAKALWENTKGNQFYWESVNNFLHTIK